VYTLARALRVYDAVRPPFTQDSAEKTRLNVRCFTFMHPIVKDIGEKDGFSKEEVKGMLARMAEVVVNNWKWVWSTTLDQSVEDALKILDEA
jgi:salicylate hydroxylase